MIYIKDRDADLQAGIRTIPTLFGERTSKIIISFLTLVAYLNVPLILGIKNLWYPSLGAGLLGCWWVLKRPWREGPYFITYFVYYIVMLYFLQRKILTGV